MPNEGPKYQLVGSYLSDDTLLLRLLLEGLNTQARQWSEIITILDDGSLRNLENEVLEFRHLRHLVITDADHPNIVIAFMDRLHHNRDTEETLQRSEAEGIPTFVISRYGY